MGEWTYGLFGCFDNIGLCLKAYFLPCFVAGENAERADQGSCLTCGIAYFTPCNIYFLARTREAVRERYNIEGTFLNDCLMSWICHFCSQIQVARELDHRITGMAMARV